MMISGGVSSKHWGGGDMASAEGEPIPRVWGQSPQRGPGAAPPGHGSGGAKPPEHGETP